MYAPFCRKNRIKSYYLIMLVAVSSYLSASFERSSIRLQGMSSIRTYDLGSAFQPSIEDIHASLSDILDLKRDILVEDVLYNLILQHCYFNVTLDLER